MPPVTEASRCRPRSKQVAYAPMRPSFTSILLTRMTQPMFKPFVSFLVLACITGSASRALEPASERIVVLIGVDGLAYSCFDDPKAEMPAIRPTIAA